MIDTNHTPYLLLQMSDTTQRPEFDILNVQSKKYMQYFAQEVNYMGKYEETDPEAYDVNLCINDFQTTKRRRTQDDETADYE